MAKDKTERELLVEISQKLDRLVAVTAAQGKDADTQIGILRGFGFDWTFIGSFIGLQPEAARMRHTRSKNS